MPSLLCKISAKLPLVSLFDVNVYKPFVYVISTILPQVFSYMMLHTFSDTKVNVPAIGCHSFLSLLVTGMPFFIAIYAITIKNIIFLFWFSVVFSSIFLLFSLVSYSPNNRRLFGIRKVQKGTTFPLFERIRILFANLVNIFLFGHVVFRNAKQRKHLFHGFSAHRVCQFGRN